MHWPPPARALAPVWREFLALRSQGLVRAVGVSNYSVAQIDTLTRATGEGPAVNQIPWSPAQYDEAILVESRERGVTLEASTHGVTPAQVVLRWHLEHGIAVIPKSARPDRIAANFDVLRFSLTS